MPLRAMAGLDAARKIGDDDALRRNEHYRRHDCHPMNRILTPAVMADAQAAALTCRAVAERMNTSRWAVRLAEDRTGIRLEPMVRRERGVVASMCRPVSAVCAGCGRRWVPLVVGTRCSLCVGNR